MVGRKLLFRDILLLLDSQYNTNTGYLKYAPISELSFDIEGAKKYLNKLGYSGLFSLEFIRDNSG